MKDFEKWIKKQIDYYSPIVGIELQKVYIERNDENDNFISIKCTYPYLDPTIYYSSSAYNSWKKRKIKKDRILHELCHILTDPLYCVSLDRFITKDTIENEREKLTDTITAIIRKLDNN